MNYRHLTQTLVESFNTLADEVQALTDRKTVLEHKLRFAHEQFQYLADKHAPAAPEIAETLLRLQIPPELDHPAVKDATSVPLPRRAQVNGGHQVALLIRDGRRAAQQLSSLGESSKASLSSHESFSRPSHSATSMSTVLEQDFTVEGKKGHLGCPFSAPVRPQTADVALVDKSTKEGEEGTGAVSDPTPHQSTDPICAAMFEETMNQKCPSTSGSLNKCPIRFMDQHSPEEIAQFVEKHKHDLPRSHEVCLRRYQRNGDQVKKLDAKYGSLANMIQGLGHIHQPMLPLDTADHPDRDETSRSSNARVESWAHEVSATAGEYPSNVESERGGEGDARTLDGAVQGTGQVEREGHFDRPLKEVRVGESPSRPWGISIPVYAQDDLSGQRPVSPPPAPVFLPQPTTPEAGNVRKCPFDHTKLRAMQQLHDNAPPASHTAKSIPARSEAQIHEPQAQPRPVPDPAKQAHVPPPATGLDNFAEPTFVAPSTGSRTQSPPQMVFTGPVFIGYPMDQAIQLLQHYKGGRQ